MLARMAIDVLTSLPDAFFAGDTVKMRSSPAGFPAPDWVGTLYFNGPDAFSVEAVADGTSQLYTIPSTLTAGLPSGIYSWSESVESGDERTTTGAGNVWIKPNASVEVLSWAQECLTLIRAHIKNRLPAGLQNHSINGSSVSKIPLTEAVKLEQYFAGKVIEEQRLALNYDDGTNGRILLVFDRP